jgi:hypothetical protein
MRNHWLQEALELLEPRSVGRPPKSQVDPRQKELEQTNSQLEQQLLEAQVRRDVDQILVTAGAPAAESEPPLSASKKKRRGGRRGRAPRRAR